MIETADTKLNETEEPAGLANEDDEELLAEIWRELKQARNHFSESRREGITDDDYFAGRQWSQEDLAKLEEQERPAVCFNRVVRTINAISGLEVQNRQEPNCYAVEEGDNGVGEYATNVLRWARQKCDAEDEDSEAFRDSLRRGIGWTETYVEFNGMLRDILVGKINWREMIYDPMSVKSNCADARWVARVKDMKRKQFLEDFPNEEFTPYNFWGADGESSEPHDATNAWKYENDQADKVGSNKTMSIIQHQYWSKEKFYAVAGPDGNVIEVDKARFGKLKKLVDEAGMQYTEITKKVFKQCIVTPKKILKKTALESNNFTFQAITGFHDESNNTWFGVIRLMRDPQMWANKFLSQTMHIVNTGAKNGLFAEEGAISNIQKVENEYSKPGNITLVRQNALVEGRIQPKPAPQYPDGIDRLMTYSISAIQDVVGVSLEMLGMADRDQPIGLEESRKKAGITILANFFDSLRRYRKMNARVLMDYIRAYLPEGTLVRIVGEQGAQYVPLIKDRLTAEFDIIVDDAPTSTNMKERVFAVLAQFLPMALQSGIPVPPEILDYAPLPEVLIQKWKQLITDSQNNPEQQQMKQMQMATAQLDIQQKQVDVKKTSSEVVANYAKAEQYHGVGQDQQALAMQKMSSEHGMKQQDMMNTQRLKEYEMLMNHQRKQKEAEISMQNKQKEAEMAMYHKQQMHQMDMQYKAMRPPPGA